MHTPEPTTLSNDARIVIIGAGQAGGWAAHTLRDEKFAGTITLIGEEPWPPHERPPLSKAVLAGVAPPESTHLFPLTEWAALDIDWRGHHKVLAIDRAARTVDLDDGNSVGWDRLILCTGGRARTLTIPGLEEASTTLRTIDDSIQLHHRLRPASRLLIVGGGWIGLEVAATARQLGVDVTVIETAPQLCARSLPAEAAQLLASLHKQNGVHILLGGGLCDAKKNADGSITAQLSITNQQKPTRKRTESVVNSSAGHAVTEQITADVIVAGIGMIPNDELARSAGVACANGVLVDQYCRTSDPSIFAAGDVAINSGGRATKPFRLESWQNAQQQGIAAARCALGAGTPYEPMPWFWSDQFGVNVQILGTTNDADQWIVRGSPQCITSETSVIFFYLRGGILRGVIGFNAGRDIRTARRLIEQSTVLDTDALANPSVSLKTLA
ncbi:NAD(P)/FAD-dependent oxidoreductase [Paralcaligenes ureilyticus]|uniref:3-phenylpropionate/trans-cinnamate dioxygenase ferredoxin reductase subunit n=1 Tax=Paralcaligenes ureilyticus TaxID=627131 RepID=A0A4R3M8J6_9BURK|nr:FAD-dependent oxidoreductase [Paralcaligenes ureilyticus]TCT09422.1 3-phenylpropionate/trans-cinnamate dioxygenase ferredoxin reductase subunit [Paralcaligenes ureilyticus]